MHLYILCKRYQYRNDLYASPAHKLQNPPRFITIIIINPQTSSRFVIRLSDQTPHIPRTHAPLYPYPVLAKDLEKRILHTTLHTQILPPLQKTSASFKRNHGSTEHRAQGDSQKGVEYLRCEIIANPSHGDVYIRICFSYSPPIPRASSTLFSCRIAHLIRSSGVNRKGRTIGRKGP